MLQANKGPEPDKALDDFLLPWTMDKPFVDDTFVFLGILFISSISGKVFIFIIQVAQSSELGLLITFDWELGHTMTAGECALMVANSTGIIEHLLVTSPGHRLVRDVMNPTLMNKLGQGVMILRDSIY